MAANQSIKELMAAETKASKIISEARQERGERLKQAKVEAEAEIAAYRLQQDQAFQMNSTDLLGDDSSIMDQETEQDIQKMRNEYMRNKDSVLQLMTGHVTKVVLKVPVARKETHKA
ncbi:V-type ATPase [Saprolegnia parasitica CBS 223.65]|uniref:V-type proton ATPase subunit G n=1 Tax=Saprolegnia parasitica (strain CBS 223.65) TaxID=695850 RepID=A0A067C8F1_SAPPC|nr:V-type ATPase [Saprolegnia parasitica CBS 223.65]KDO22811.1 V-type ATPase [Saprolegnia parasitica CBS 223.65]|eukprot:XP_012206482.1 V-type ATPase [Saprolegnia parasitica CBS 223.65]